MKQRMKRCSSVVNKIDELLSLVDKSRDRQNSETTLSDISSLILPHSSSKWGRRIQLEHFQKIKHFNKKSKSERNKIDKKRLN